jgi:threonine synthase
MKFYSTNNRDLTSSLRDAVIRGLAPDNGLFMPEKIPILPDAFLQSLHERSFRDVAFAVAKNLIGEDLPDRELKAIVEHTIAFDAPLVEIEKDIFTLELFHGPTLAFKDFGARFMSRLLGYFARQQDREIVILVATSGDTGSAVANGFLEVPGTRVIVLYPSGKVSDIQEKQFTTLGRNITALEVQGTFDDCQRLVKQAFQDAELNAKYFLTSANSINIARLIPQSLYYFRAWGQLKDRKKPVVFSVPSGNFGNLTGGLLAKRMGLPIDHFVVSTNRNDVVPKFLQTGIFEARDSIQTISNAMDVGNPSNLARMIDLYQGDLRKLALDVTGYSFSDDETRTTMQQVFKNTGYVLDPHGAVGYAGLKQYLSRRREDVTGIFLETAHPGKFREVVEETLSEKLLLPEKLVAFLTGEKRSVGMNAQFESFKKTLMHLLTSGQ